MAAAKKAASGSKPRVGKKKARVAKAAKTARQKPAKAASVPTSAGTGAASGQGAKGLRVRVYRVGFGDFFLLTVSTAKADNHILIDCSLHPLYPASIPPAFPQLASACRD